MNIISISDCQTSAPLSLTINDLMVTLVRPSGAEGDKAKHYG